MRIEEHDEAASFRRFTGDIRPVCNPERVCQRGRAAAYWGAFKGHQGLLAVTTSLDAIVSLFVCVPALS